MPASESCQSHDAPLSLFHVPQARLLAHVPAPCPPSQISTLQAKLAGAEDAYKQADGIAQAAMEAAEEAVRDEMETIAGGQARGEGIRS